MMQVPKPTATRNSVRNVDDGGKHDEPASSTEAFCMPALSSNTVSSCTNDVRHTNTVQAGAHR